MDDGAPSLAQTEETRRQLRRAVERIETLEAERTAVADQIKDVYKDARNYGLDTKAIRTVVRLRRQDRAKREEAQAILDSYLHALGEI